jgi:hypothetical protein
MVPVRDSPARFSYQAESGHGLNCGLTRSDLGRSAR